MEHNMCKMEHNKGIHLKLLLRTEHVGCSNKKLYCLKIGIRLEVLSCGACRLPDLKIVPGAFSSNKATTQIFTAYLATAPGWNLGVGIQLPWTRCVQHVLTPDNMLEAVSKASGAIRCGRALRFQHALFQLAACDSCYVTQPVLPLLMHVFAWHPLRRGLVHSAHVVAIN